jgi:N-acetylglucosaminyldiphosphoundecaprenol N-acetyl-beta-D-mannosaminyltransferase
MQSKKLLGININLGTYSSFISTLIEKAKEKKPYYACVANVHMLIEAHHSGQYTNIVNGADLVTPDGKPLTWALKFLYGIKQDRVAGMDLLPDLLKESEMNNISIAFYGGTQTMLDKTKDHITQKYPGLHIAAMYSPPFRSLTKDEEDTVVEIFRNSGADLIFVVLGCPKQEKWMASMKGRIAAVMIGIGGALPVFVGIQKRAPRWMQNAGLEWFYRLMQEPGRLYKRYASTNSLFVYLVLKSKYLFKK